MAAFLAFVLRLKVVVVALATAVDEGVTLLLDGVVVPGRLVLIARTYFGRLGAECWAGERDGVINRGKARGKKNDPEQKTYPGGRQNSLPEDWRTSH